MIDILFWAFVGMLFAWFIVPDPPDWISWTKNFVWNKISSWTK